MQNNFCAEAAMDFIGEVARARSMVALCHPYSAAGRQ
jgi:hypothetical protein